MGNCLRLGISRIGLAWTKRRMKTSNKRNSISLLILGTQAVGKTTIALRLWKFKRTLPDLNYVQTKGFNTYAIRRKNKGSINLYDLGGHPSIQELWDHYYADAHGIIFVVDVSNPESLAEAATVFPKVVNDERIRGKPILLLANKQDLGGASEVELDSVMNLQEVVNAARCLTRLDESAATDLKNDKGIFDGFRWLVSHIKNHYHELNDRVMHDILEEKNREKARRAAIKEQLEQSSSTPQMPLPINPNYHEDQSQQSLVSKTFVRDESSVNLKQQGDNEYESQFPKSTQPGLNLGQGSKPNKLGSIRQSTPSPTNYLIKSRPTSSLESHNPFLLPRNAANAPSIKRRSLPTLQPLSGKTNGTLVPTSNRFFTNVAASQIQSGLRGEDPFVVSTKESHPPEASTFSAPIGMVSGGRLSPEGANSESGDSMDEKGGIVNHGFDDKTENFYKMTKAEQNVYATDAPNHNMPQMPSVTEVSPTGSGIEMDSPEKFRKLIRTESSDTERAGEILMVTTLAQVHQDHISNGRRRSSTSTHDSIALSLSSFKSEEVNIMEEWSNKEEDGNSKNQDLKRKTPSQSQQGNGTETKEMRVTTPATIGKQNSSRPEKETRGKSGLMRTGIGKNKTIPLPPAVVSASSHDGSSGSGTSRTAPPSISGRYPGGPHLSGKRSRENVFIVGPNPPVWPKNTVKKTGFSDTFENSKVSQFAKNRPISTTGGTGTGLTSQRTGPKD